MRAKPKSEEAKAEQVLLLRNAPLKQVENFKYLGATISAYTDCIQDIRIRTAIALKAMAELHKTWGNNRVSINTKVRLYRALIQPIALYGCESWTLTQYEEKKLLVFEMAALKKIHAVRRLIKLEMKISELKQDE